MLTLCVCYLLQALHEGRIIEVKVDVDEVKKPVKLLAPIERENSEQMLPRWFPIYRDVQVLLWLLAAAARHLTSFSLVSEAACDAASCHCMACLQVRVTWFKGSSVYCVHLLVSSARPGVSHAQQRGHRRATTSRQLQLWQPANKQISAHISQIGAAEEFACN